MSALLLLVALLASTVPVSGRHHVVTWEDLKSDPAATVCRGLDPADAFVIHRPDSAQIIGWPFYTVTMGGDTLCTRLLGYDTELVLGRLGLHDQSPYNLTVDIVFVSVGADGVPRQTWLSSSMTKHRFDDDYGLYESPTVCPRAWWPTPPRR